MPAKKKLKIDSAAPVIYEYKNLDSLVDSSILTNDKNVSKSTASG